MNNEETRRIINENLSSLIDRLEFTQVLLENKKNAERLEKTKTNTLFAERLSDDLQLIEFIREYTANLEHNLTSDGFFKGKSSFQTLLGDVNQELKRKLAKLNDSIQSDLVGLRVMNKDIYSKISKSIDIAYGDLVRVLYPKDMPAPLKNMDKEKIVKMNLPLDTNSWKIQSGSSYRVVEKVYEDDKGEIQKEYSSHNIVDACLEINKKKQQELNKELASISKTDEGMDVDKHFASSFDYELNLFNENVYPAITDKDIENIKKALEKKTKINKTIYKFEKVRDLIESKMHDEKKYDLIAKLDKELIVLKEQFANIQKEISKYKEELAARKTPEQKYEESVQRLHEKQVKKEVEEMLEAHVKSNNSLGINEQQNKEPKKGESIESQPVMDESITKLSDAYKQYAAIRDTLDNIKEEVKARNAGFNQQKYEQEVERQLHRLGNSYAEIMDEIVEMHNCVDAMKDIKELLDSCKLELNHNEEKMNTQSGNGFTPLESMFKLKLVEKHKDKNIPADLRKEIEYYLDRYEKIESSVKGWPEGSKERKNLANIVKQDYFSNTILIDEINKKDENKNMER